MHVRFQSPSSGVLESNQNTCTLKSSVDTFSVGAEYTLIDILDPCTILIIFNSLRVTLTRRCNDCFRYHAGHHFETSAYIQERLVSTDDIYAHVIAAANFF